MMEEVKKSFQNRSHLRQNVERPAKTHGVANVATCQSGFEPASNRHCARSWTSTRITRLTASQRRARRGSRVDARCHASALAFGLRLNEMRRALCEPCAIQAKPQYRSISHNDGVCKAFGEAWRRLVFGSFLGPFGHLAFDDSGVDAVAADGDLFLLQFPDQRGEPAGEGLRRVMLAFRQATFQHAEAARERQAIRVQLPRPRRRLTAPHAIALPVAE